MKTPLLLNLISACTALFVFISHIHAEGEENPLSIAPHVKATWQAGLASTVITPEKFIWMGGYAARNRPAKGKEQDLYAKALVLEDKSGTRLAIVAIDVLGVSKGTRMRIASEVEREHGLGPEALLLNASHTHSGPEIYRKTDPPDELELKDPKTRDAWEFTSGLEKRIVSLVGEALADLSPARLTWNEAKCGFAMNRRRDYTLPSGHPNAEKRPNLAGPVDHAVPALRIEAEDGHLRGVLFGYACHNTSLSGYHWSGDYAGYAQEYLEEHRKDFTALFITGCGGDQNPYPRRSNIVPGISEVELAQHHGRSLANAVEMAISANPIAVDAPLRTAYAEVGLDFEDPNRPAHDYPVQVARFGEAFVLVALGSEVVVDYSLRLKREFGEQFDLTGVWVAGYSNDYTGYIPSVRIQEEGGYEAETGYARTTEERIVRKVHTLYETLHD